MGGPEMAPQTPQPSEAPRQSRGAPRYPYRLLPFWFFLVTLALWQIASRLDHPDFVLSPVEIASHFIEALRSGELLPHVGASLVRALPGFVIGSLVGVALGLMAGIARSLDQLLSPVVFLTYPVPKIVFLPIVMLWVGIGDVSKILIIALAHQEHLGVEGEHARERDPLFHPARELARQVIAKLREPRQLEVAVHDGGTLRSGSSTDLEPPADVAAHGAPREERELLEDHAAVRPRPDDLAPVDTDLSGVRRDETAQNVE